MALTVLFKDHHLFGPEIAFEEIDGENFAYITNFGKKVKITEACFDLLIEMLQKGKKHIDYLNDQAAIEKELYHYNLRTGKPRIKDESGYVYLAWCRSSKLWKIGKTKRDPLIRISNIKTCNPSIMDYFYFEVSNMNVERILHEKYSDKRVKGEWFRLTHEDIHDISMEYCESYREI
jgi:Meiotically up-regulated gene 113